MSLEAKPLTSIAESDIQNLVDNKVREGKKIDFKVILPGGSESDHKEFLADVSSFANAAGGDLIFGVQDDEGSAVAAPGLSDANPDAQLLRIEAMIRDGIAPRLRAEVRPVFFASGRYAIVLRIARSWNGPHMVILKNWSRFFSRNSAGKYQLDVGELRAAFVLSEAVAEKIKQFRFDRLAKIVANETPLPLGDGPKLAVHLVPFAMFDLQSPIPMPLPRSVAELIWPMAAAACNSRYNFDGYVATTNSESSASYAQLFRTGAIETATNRIFGETNKTIPGQGIEQRILKTVDDQRAVLRALDVPPPVALLISLLGVGGYRIFHDGSQRGYPVDRKDLLLPELLIEDPTVSTETLLRPTLDVIWSACGIPQSPYYDQSGNRLTT